MQVGNHLAELDVDIDIDEVNETPTLQAEQFDALMQLVGTGVFGTPVPPEISEMIVAASNFREKQKLMDIVEKMKAAAAQPNPVAEQAQQIQLAGESAKVDETKSKTVLNVARAHSEAAQPMIQSFTAGARAPQQ
jgi:predicted metal-dependent phosphotriesterase family hydrolase